MLANYLTIAFRNLLSNKLFSLINVLGLSIGLVACLLIVQYVSVKWSYDRFLPHSESIYRIALDKNQEGGRRYQTAANYGALAVEVKESFPEILAAGRAFRTYIVGNCIFSAQRNGERVQFEEKQFFHADQGFLQIFNYQTLQGDLSTALHEPFTAVLTRTAAEKYFGSDWHKQGNNLGKTIQLSYAEGEHDYRVRAIIEDLPAETHLLFTLLLSLRTYEKLHPDENFEQSWGAADTFTYILLKPGTNANQLEAKLPALLEQHKEKLGFTKQVGDRLFLQPLGDIHLHSRLNHEAQPNGNAQTVSFLLLIAGIILLLAWANYVNLTLAKSLYRTKEVGVRKVIGASRRHLIFQFVCESLLTYSLVIVVAGILLFAIAPIFEQISGHPLKFTFFQHPFLWLLFFGCLATGSLLSCAYPAFVLSGASPIRALKGMAVPSRRLGLRQGLIVVQFGMTAVLMIATLLIYRQYGYMQEQNLGIDIDQVLVINTPRVGFSNGSDAYVSGVNFFKNELRRQGGIKAVSTSIFAPGMELFDIQVRREADSTSSGEILHFMSMDSDFVTVFNLSLVAGRNFISGVDHKPNQVMLNEAAASLLGFENAESAIGKQIILPWGEKQEVIGVLANFHQLSLHRPYQPLYIVNLPHSNEFFFVKMESGNLAQTIQAIEGVYKQAFPGNLFSYFFQDEFFNRQYASDKQFARITYLFTGLAIFIACLGLLGVSWFASGQRTKEVGVRKVLGASVFQVLVLLSKDFLKLVLLSNVIAWPLAYWAMHQWLQNYAFRVEMSPFLFVIPGLFLLLIAMVTVGIHTFRAAQANPVDSLRNE